MNILSFGRFVRETPAEPSVAAAFRFDNVKIDTLSAVPEPEEYPAVFGVSIVGFALWCRRNGQAYRSRN